MHPIIQMLKAHKVSNYKFCKAMGVGLGALSNMESRGTPVDRVSAGIIYKLAKFLDVPMQVLYEELLILEESTKNI